MAIWGPDVAVAYANQRMDGVARAAMTAKGAFGDVAKVATGGLIRSCVKALQV